MFVFQDAVQLQFRRFTPIVCVRMCAFFFKLFFSEEHMFECIFSSRKGLFVRCFVYIIPKVFFFTKDITENVLKYFSCYLVRVVNKSDCCLIRVTPFKCDSPRYSSLMDRVSEHVPSSLSFTAPMNESLVVSNKSLIFCLYCSPELNIAQ